MAPIPSDQSPPSKVPKHHHTTSTNQLRQPSKWAKHSKSRTPILSKRARAADVDPPTLIDRLSPATVRLVTRPHLGVVAFRGKRRRARLLDHRRTPTASLLMVVGPRRSPPQSIIRDRWVVDRRCMQLDIDVLLPLNCCFHS